MTVTWANKLGAIAKSTSMVTSPSNRDFNVISSPFEVVEQREIDRDYQQAVLLPLASNFKLSKFLEEQPENSVEKNRHGVHTISPFGKTVYFDHLLLHGRIFRFKKIHTEPLSKPVSSAELLIRIS